MEGSGSRGWGNRAAKAGEGRKLSLNGQRGFHQIRKPQHENGIKKEGDMSLTGSQTPGRWGAKGKGLKSGEKKRKKRGIKREL